MPHDMETALVFVVDRKHFMSLQQSARRSKWTMRGAADRTQQATPLVA
jgi:hypothetical protein